MTDHEWQNCDDPGKMATAVWPRALDWRDRTPSVHGWQLRLWACACVRQVWDLLGDGPRRWIETVEAYHTDRANEFALLEVQKEADASPGVRPLHGRSARRLAFFAAHHAAYLSTTDSASFRAWKLTAEARQVETFQGPFGEHYPARPEADLLREVLGDSLRFRPVGELQLHPHLPGLLAAAADGRHPQTGHLDTDALHAVADAAEEAGCAEQALLGHLHGPGPHVLGCWALSRLYAAAGRGKKEVSLA